MPDKTSALDEPYEMVSVRRAAPPPGEAGTNWYRYVIVQGKNTIRGYRKGELKAVTSSVEEIVAQLNERRSGKRGRVSIVPTPKRTTTT